MAEDDDNTPVTVSPPHGSEARLRRLNDVFLAENAKQNLSAFRTPETCWTGNILDSLAAVPVFNQCCTLHAACSILDIGTGGGFPLLPLAMVFPQHRFTGMDSTRKKIDAVQRMVETLALPNVDLVCARAEDAARNPLLREQFDMVTARALAPLNVLLEYAAPFAKPGGMLLFWKSMHVHAELAEALLARAELSCEPMDPVVYDLGPSWGQRQILLYRKRSRTSQKYPRQRGVPSKSPLA